MREAILSAAMQLANLKGYKRLTRNDIATRAGVAAGSVSYHFKNMALMRTAMVERAVETSNLRLLGQALADRHPVAMRAPQELRTAAATQLAQ